MKNVARFLTWRPRIWAHPLICAVVAVLALSPLVPPVEAQDPTAYRVFTLSDLGNGQIRLSWTVPPGPFGYDLDRYTIRGTHQILTLSRSTTTYSDSLTPDDPGACYRLNQGGLEV